MMSSILVSRYPMICAGINIQTTSRPRLTPLLAFYAVASSAIHRSKSTVIKPSYIQFLNTAKLFGIHTLPCPSCPSPSGLRSAERGDLIVPRAATKFGNRAFAISGPLMWNSLPTTVRNSSTLSNFKSALKSHLFTLLFLRLHQQLRSVTAPLNRFYVLWCHRNRRGITIIITRAVQWVEAVQQRAARYTHSRYHLQSFYPRTVRDWNTPPEATVQLDTVEAFRRALLIS